MISTPQPLNDLTQMKSAFVLLLILICSVQSYSFGQDERESVESISFAQGFAAFRSQILISAEEDLQKGNYAEIISLLDAHSVSNRFVGAVLCEYLEKEAKIVLTIKQMEKINDIKQSSDQLSFNFGCTCRSVLSLKEYFEGKDACSFRQSMARWMEETIEK